MGASQLKHAHLEQQVDTNDLLVLYAYTASCHCNAYDLMRDVPSSILGRNTDYLDRDVFVIPLSRSRKMPEYCLNWDTITSCQMFSSFSFTNHCIIRRYTIYTIDSVIK